MNACQEILCRAALAWTLTQVPGIGVYHFIPGISAA